MKPSSMLISRQTPSGGRSWRTRRLKAELQTIMHNYDVIIAGGGPAGASAAIHLAMRGTRVLLAEQKKFPRPKLCGEFISPECAIHFQRLHVAEAMSAAHPANLTATVLYSR